MPAGTALVTGASQGIGFAVARALLGRGWKVGICARRAEGIERAASELTGGLPAVANRLHAAAADVSREDEAKRWITEAAARLGPPDLLVNNAGIGVFGEIPKLTTESWDRALAVNLRSAFLCTREVLPAMRAKGSGYIVNISSVAGKKGMSGTAAYSASKFGMIGLSQSLQDEVKGQNIRVTAICPGYVATPLAEGAKVPASDMIQPEDIAATVLYLLDLTPKVVIREIVIERIGAV
jgi:3-oxoacyl-[acyl-carrier protein] reductase